MRRPGGSGTRPAFHRRCGRFRVESVRPLLLPGLLLVGAFALLSRLSDPIASYPTMLGAVALASTGWLLGWRRARRLEGRRAGVGVVLAGALLARLLALVPSVPLSDDLYRYLWDGRVGNAGVNPFRYAPAAPELAPLREARIWPRINHREVPTIYPPVAQLTFRVLDLVAPSPRGARAAAAVADLGTFLLLAVLMRRRGRPAELALVHGWCPLAVLESAGGGHVDSLGVALLVGAILLLGEARTSGRKAAAAGALVGLSAQVKPMGLLLAPALLRRGPGCHRLGLLGGGMLAAVLAVPYLDAGLGLFAGFATYARHWSFHDLLFSAGVRAGLGADAMRALLGILLLGAALRVPLRLRDPAPAAGVLFGLFLLLSPTVYPWYALWLVPLLPFVPARLRAAAVTLVGLLPVTYSAAWLRSRTGDWTVPLWSWALLWGPVVVLLACGVLLRPRPAGGLGGGAGGREPKDRAVPGSPLRP